MDSGGFYVRRWNKEKADSETIGFGGYYKHDISTDRVQ